MSNFWTVLLVIAVSLAALTNISQTHRLNALTSRIDALEAPQ